MITITGLLILAYEKDYEDIDYTIKRTGILLVLGAMMCTGFGVVYLKTVLNRKDRINVEFEIFQSDIKETDPKQVITNLKNEILELL